MTTKESVSSTEVLGKTQEHLYPLYGGVYLHKNMKEDFDALVLAAKTDGINIQVASGFRSFERQLAIWNNKFSGKAAIKNAQGDTLNIKELSELDLIHSILLYSALPGASRHHWGSDIDVYATNLLPRDYNLKLEPWEYQDQGPLAQLSTWLNHNAYKFGFYLPYAQYQGGVAEEPWHLSYLPIAKHYEEAFDIQTLATCLQHSEILGKDIIIEHLADIAEHYINNVCQAQGNVKVSTV